MVKKKKSFAGWKGHIYEWQNSQRRVNQLVQEE